MSSHSAQGRLPFTATALAQLVFAMDVPSHGGAMAALW